MKKAGHNVSSREKAQSVQSTDHESETEEANEDETRSGGVSDDDSFTPSTESEAVDVEDAGRPRRAKKRPMFDYDEIVHVNMPKNVVSKTPLKAVKVEADQEGTEEKETPKKSPALRTCTVLSVPQPPAPPPPLGGRLLSHNDIVQQEMSHHNVKVLIGKARSIIESTPKRPKVSRSTQISASCGTCMQRSKRQRTRGTQTDEVKVSEDVNKAAVLITRPTFKDFMTFIDNMMKLYERVAFDQGTEPVQVVLKPGAAVSKQRGAGESAGKNDTP